MLVIDDYEDAAAAAALYLTVAGYDAQFITAAGDVPEAAARYRPEVVLLDINMPGKNGFAVAVELRACEATRHAVLVAYTSEEWHAIRDLAVASGFDGYFRKASDVSALLNLLASYADACSLSDQAMRSA